MLGQRMCTGHITLETRHARAEHRQLTDDIRAKIRRTKRRRRFLQQPLYRIKLAHECPDETRDHRQPRSRGDQSPWQLLDPGSYQKYIAPIENNLYAVLFDQRCCAVEIVNKK